MAKKHDLNKRVFSEGNALDFPKSNDGKCVDFKKDGVTFASLNQDAEGKQTLTFYPVKDESFPPKFEFEEHNLIEEMLENALAITKMDLENGIEFEGKENSFKTYASFVAAINSITEAKNPEDPITSEIASMFRSKQTSRNTSDYKPGKFEHTDLNYHGTIKPRPRR